MGAFTAIGSDSNIQDKTYPREIEQGFYERFVCADAASRPTWATSTGSTAADTNIQQASFWAARQNAVSTLITNASHKFLQAGSYGVPPAAMPDVNNSGTSQAAISTHTAAGTLWNLVTGNSGGPRRYTVHPDAGGSPSYGACQAGDIIDYWLIEDLQLALCYLRYVLIDAADVSKVSSWYFCLYQDGEYYQSGAWHNANFIDAMDHHDANLSVWTSGTGTQLSYMMARILRLDSSTPEWIYHADTDIYTYRGAGVSLPTAAYNHKLWIGGQWTAGSDTFFALNSSDNGAQVLENQIGILGQDATWQAGTSRTVHTKNLVSRLIDRDVTLPSTSSGNPVYDCQVDTPFVLAEWEWTKGEMA